MRLRASVTVETTLIMPFVLLVIFLIISIGFYEQDTSAIIESSFNLVRNKSLYKYNGEENQTATKETCMIAENINMSQSEELTKNVVNAEGVINVYFMNKVLNINEKQSYLRCYGPDLIRLVNVGVSIKDSITNESEK